MSRRKSLIALFVVPLAVLLSLVTVGVANARSAHPAAQIATPTITIHNFAYTVPTSVLHGALVKVVNNDSVKHTVTSNRVGKFDVTVAANSSKSFHAPSKPMKYGFHCNFHASMAGILKVR